MDDKKNKEDKFFNWHWFPEEPIELRSVVEMVVFLLIVGACFFLYKRWNTVPKRQYEFRVEDLSDGVVYDSAMVSIDSVRRVLSCKISYNIPMTDHKEFAEKLQPCQIEVNPFQSDDVFSDFMKIAFVNDSIRNIPNSKSDIEPIIDKYNLRSEYESYALAHPTKPNLDSYKKLFKDSLNVSQDSCVMVYFQRKHNKIYFSEWSYEIWDHFDPLMLGHCYPNDVDKSYVAENYIAFLHKNKNGASFETNERTLPGWYSYFNIYYPFRGGLPMETPRWGRLEDISQAYIDFKIESSTIDSIVLNINFVGATDFSYMDPMPDKIGMSNIVFNDPIKIFKIKANGLRFHARFKELENWQQIRVFTVTAIMSAFILAFVVFVIKAYFKIQKKFKKNRNSPVTVIILLLKIVFFGIPLYSVIFWTIFYLFSPITQYSCIPISLLLSILIFLLSHHRGRTLLILLLSHFKRYMNGEGFKKHFIFVSLLFFLVLFTVDLYQVSTMSFDMLLRRGKHNSATKMMYNKIVLSDTVNSDDVKKLRMALLGTGALIPDSGHCKIKDGIMLNYVDDTLMIYDLQKSYYYQRIIQNLRYATVLDSTIIVCQSDDNVTNNFYLYSKEKQFSAPVKIGIDKSYYIESFSDNRKTVIMTNYNDSTISFVNITHGPKLIKKMKLPIIKGNRTFIKDRILIVEDNDNDQIMIYNITHDKPRLEYRGKGRNIKIMNEAENLCIYQDLYRGYDYIVGITSDGIFTDSLQNFSGYFGKLSSRIWTPSSVKYLKKATNANKIIFVGTDNNGAYFFNEDTKEIEFDDSKNNRKKFIKLKSKAWPHVYVNENRTYVVQNSSDSLYIYDDNGLVFQKGHSKSLWFRDGYIIDNDKNVVYPFLNPVDSFVAEKIEYVDHIVNGWMYRESKNPIIQNIVSNDSLIKRSKYLTNCQKLKLIKKLR